MMNLGQLHDDWPRSPEGGESRPWRYARTDVS